MLLKSQVWFIVQSSHTDLLHAGIFFLTVQETVKELSLGLKTY
jgi:hypothetical protein